MVEFKLERRHRNVTDEQLIKDLKRVAKRVKKRTVTCVEYQNHGKFGMSTVCTRFGSWLCALRKAGLRMSRNPFITERELFENLKNVWTKLGRAPRVHEMYKPFSIYSVRPYIDRFGTWGETLKKFVRLMKNGGVKKLGAQVEIHPRRRSRGPRTVGAGLRLAVLRRDNFRCKLCGASLATDPQVSLHADHIRPWSKGGRTVIENLQTLCSRCNSAKRDLDIP